MDGGDGDDAGDAFRSTRTMLVSAAGAVAGAVLGFACAVAVHELGLGAIIVLRHLGLGATVWALTALLTLYVAGECARTLRISWLTATSLCMLGMLARSNTAFMVEAARVFARGALAGTAAVSAATALMYAVVSPAPSALHKMLRTGAVFFVVTALVSIVGRFL